MTSLSICMSLNQAFQGPKTVLSASWDARLDLYCEQEQNTHTQLKLHAHTHYIVTFIVVNLLI